ncbi:DUF952 domain-containing protein [Salisediminibacterium beveridgei]|uniref:Uncharacterized protein n=1 Tax=Salisediminibacterium beveridgei TaxID=632773 RepID=A0A1D7QVC1_9BACI|nr:DUF952 domain-containing protein [Salisediminibacterium beveridgei]AOM82966.1 hypothetical protein BBEV_1605 [Salisediminibacterium beveridgei]
MIYYFITKEELAFALEEEEYFPDYFDDTGYISCVSEKTVPAMIAELNTDQEYVILKFDDQLLESAVIYEDIEDTGIMQPHVYGFLNMDALIEAEEVERTKIKIPT